MHACSLTPPPHTRASLLVRPHHIAVFMLTGLTWHVCIPAVTVTLACASRSSSTQQPPTSVPACRFDKSQLPTGLPLSSPSAETEERNARNSFNFELAYIKAQPVRTEPTVILVSCAGAAGTDAVDGAADADRGAFAGPEANVLGAAEGVNARRVALKRRGEAGLRSSGVGYCIVRPSKLLQEPGGYKALVFDQGDRIQQVRRRAMLWRLQRHRDTSACMCVMHCRLHSPPHALQTQIPGTSAGAQSAPPILAHGPRFFRRCSGERCDCAGLAAADVGAWWCRE